MSKNKYPRSVAFNKVNDKEMLQFVDTLENFSGYVKELIKADMSKRNSSLKIVHKSEKGGIKIVLG